MFLVSFFLSFFLLSFSVFAKVSPLKKLPHSSPQSVTEALANYNQAKKNFKSANELVKNARAETERKASECERLSSETNKLIMNQQHDRIEKSRYFNLRITHLGRCLEEFHKMADKESHLRKNSISALDQSLNAQIVHLEWSLKDTSHLDTSP